MMPTANEVRAFHRQHDSLMSLAAVALQFRFIDHNQWREMTTRAQQAMDELNNVYPLGPRPA